MLSMYTRTLSIKYHTVPSGTVTVHQNKTKQQTMMLHPSKTKLTVMVNPSKTKLTVMVNRNKTKQTVTVRCMTDRSRSWDLALLHSSLTFDLASSTSE